MDNPKYAYLVCVDGRANNNKYYEMKQVDSYNFVAAYGREGVTRTEHTYPMSKWHSVYNKRINKRRGKSYDDVTHLKTVEVVPVDDTAADDDDTSSISDSQIRSLVSRLQAFAKGSVSRNYKVSSQDVTPAMLGRADEILVELSGLLYSPDAHISNSDVNDYLEQLYIAVPRRMANVRDHLLPFGNTLDLEDAKALYNLEQANIDVMAGQVRAGTRAKAPEKKSSRRNVLDDMGVTMKLATPEQVRKVKSLGDPSKIGSVFVVTNKQTQAAFNDRMTKMNKLGGLHTRTAMYWHGSRNENWLNIIDSGLLIRPPGAVTTGAMFGLGIYFADRFEKSLNYTSYRGSYYAHGNQDTGFMALYEVQIGNQYEIGRHSNSHYDLNSASLEKRGYDSVWGKSGYSLINNEYVIFLASQCTVTYLVQLR